MSETITVPVELHHLFSPSQSQSIFDLSKVRDQIEDLLDAKIQNLPDQEIRLKHWCRLSWRDETGCWNLAVGFVLPCRSGEADYHLALVKPIEHYKCVKRSDLKIIEYT
jgi:hypothetical protein